MPKPKDVTTSNTEVLEVLRDTGDGEWSVARLRRQHQTWLGIRWNGDDTTAGYPSARGRPVWFTLPDEIAVVIEAHYRANKLADKGKEVEGSGS